MDSLIDIQKLIDEATQKRSQSKSVARDTSYFHVSDAGTCYRKRYFKRLGIEPKVPIPVGALRKMLAGEAGHQMLQDLLQLNGGLFAAEGTVKTEHILGHFDALYKTERGKLLLEFKTVEKWGMTHIKRDGPKPEHELQMFTYWSLMRGDYRDLNQASLFYVKREDFEGVPFNYLWSFDIQARVQREWRTLVAYWNRQELPPCTCNKDYGGQGIKYCRYINEDGETCCNQELLKAT